MKKTTHKFISIQTKIFILFAVAVTLSSLLVGLVAYWISRDSLKREIGNTYAISMQYVADTVAQQLKRVQSFSDYFYTDASVKQLITGGDNQSYEYFQAKESIERFVSQLYLREDAQQYLYVKILGINGAEVSWSPGRTEHLFDQAALYEAMNGAILGGDTGGMQFSIHMDDEIGPNGAGGGGYITVMRLIPDADYRQAVGCMFFAIRPEMFNNIEQSYNSDLDSTVYLFDGGGKPVNRQGAIPPAVAQVLAREGTGNATLEINDSIVLLQGIPGYQWRLVSVLPTGYLLRNNAVILTTTAIAFVAGLLLSLLIWYFVFIRIYRPLNELKQAMSQVQKGNWQARAQVMTNDEIGDLATHFNAMVSRTSSLFDELLDEQARAKDAQYRALQAQINPHFLYNTLNSIRWLAIIQKADNIKQIIDALVRLLTQSSKRTGEPIPLAQEIATVQDYLYIQKLAYGGTFEVRWDIPKDIQNAPCIPFILQPVIENALFHGLQPKHSVGTITVRARRARRQGTAAICLVIRDDGVGMSPGQCREILAQNQTGRASMTGIGIANVNERLISAYGASYSLEIESRQGEYTQVAIHIPLAEEGGRDTNENSDAG